MLLKCRYLSQFSMNELAKNASNITKAVEMCPFMTHVRRNMSGSAGINDLFQADHKEEAASLHNTEAKQQQQQQQQKMVCTDTISCPFFQNGNIDLNKMVFKKSSLYTDESIETEKEVKKMFTRKMSKVSKRSLDSDGENNAELKKKLGKLDEKNKENALFDYERFFEDKIEAKKRDGSYRNFKRIVRQAKTFPSVQELTKEAIRDVTVWCSNDYLGLGRHPYVQTRVAEAIWKYGVGSGGTRNISGSTPLHDQLEQELAQLHKKEAALVFTSCYVANDTTLFTMAKMLPNCEILSDAGNHASMIQGIRNSNVPKHIFRHNDCEHLEAILKKLPLETPKIVAFETVHSMDGSICDLHRMCDITRKYGGISFVDEVHAVGLYGENGAGIGERDNALDKIDIISGTLGKAFGNIGGYIAGSARLVDTIRSYGSGFIFTTSLPPSVAAGALAAVEISRSDEGRELRAKQQYYAKLVKDRLTEAGLPVMSSPSHIVPVMVGDVKSAGEICDRLLNEHGIYIQSINYPTVARGSERLRVVPNPHHSTEMVEKLINSLIEVWVKTGLKLMKPKNIKKNNSF